MPFDYYRRLPPKQRRIYRQSDAVRVIPLGDTKLASAAAVDLERALRAGDRTEVGRASRALAAFVCVRLKVSTPIVRVLSRRPNSSVEELYGLYERDSAKRAVIRVWMRTAAKQQVVAFRTFLRTLLHELCHHLDYEALGLSDSLHTEGFFARESSLAKQLLGSGRRRTAPASKEIGQRTRERSPQLNLF
jgi:hypothetical protein